jgi:hypothetical protein
MATEKAIRAAVKEIQKVMGYEPPIDPKADVETLVEEIRNAAADLQDGDEFTEATQAVIDELTAEEEEEEAPAPKKGKPAPKKGKPAPKKAAPVEEEEEEEEEEDDDEEEIPAPKKGKAAAKKPAKKAVEEDDDDDEEEEIAAPAPKKAKGKGSNLTPFKGTKETLGTSRMIEVAKAMAKIKGSQDIEAIAKVGDASFVKAGGTSNLKQAKNIVKVILPAAETWGIVTVKGDKLSN